MLQKYDQREILKEVTLLCKENEDFPSLSTIKKRFQTASMGDVWEEIEEQIKNAE